MKNMFEGKKVAFTFGKNAVIGFQSDPTDCQPAMRDSDNGKPVIVDASIVRNKDDKGDL